VSSVFELVAAVTLAAAAIYFVLRPILSPHQAALAADDAGADPDDDLSQRAVALRALKEIEFDRATGKLGDADYDALKRRYTAEALEALRAGEPAPLSAVPVMGPASSRSCPTHGLRTEPNAVHCSECGRRLEAGPGFCSRCGAVMESEALFCSSCGRRVAA
jgi:hypothetical protein